MDGKNIIVTQSVQQKNKLNHHIVLLIVRLLPVMIEYNFIPVYILVKTI